MRNSLFGHGKYCEKNVLSETITERGSVVLEGQIDDRNKNGTQPYQQVRRIEKHLIGNFLMRL